MLPLREVFRLRCVCKRWNALIHCVKFQERTLRSGLPWGPFHLPRVGWDGVGSPTEPWCAFDLSGRTIRKTTMAQLEFPEYARIVSWRLTAAGGGLLCFAGLLLRSQQRFLVCNPMTKAWRELPDVRFDYSTHWVTVVEKKCRSSYKILFAGDGAVDVYDSAVNKWSAVEPLTPQMSFSEMTWGSGTYHNGEIYIVGKLVRNGPKVVMILDPATLRWREDTISMPATFMENPFIVGWSGEVYLVGGDFERPVESILLFRLDAGGKWTQVGEYSNRAFMKECGGIFGCGAYGGRIFAMSRFYNMFAFQANLVAAP